MRHVCASVNKNLIYSYAQGVSCILTFFTSVTSSLWRNKRFILVIDKEFVLSSQIFTRKAIFISLRRKWPHTEMLSGVRIGESANPFFFVCIYKKANGTEGQGWSDMLSDAQSVFFFPYYLAFLRSRLSYLQYKLTTLHGRTINQVTNGSPLCFRGAALFMSRRWSPRCSNVSHLFQDTCCQDNTRRLQQ